MAARNTAPPGDIHDLDPAAFLEEVHSFEFWFQAVEGYLSGLTFGHRPDIAEAELSDIERDRLVTVLCNYCVGETAALDGASGLIAVAPNRLTKLFLATQVVDEARHLEVLLHRLRDLGIADPEGEVQRRASPSLLLFKQRLLELVASSDWEAALFAQNVILEALEFAVFHSDAQTADPVTRDVLQRIIKDERRHIGFGENELGRRLGSVPHARARLSRVKKELDHLVLDALTETMNAIAAPSDERHLLGRAYLESVERLGFT